MKRILMIAALCGVLLAAGCAAPAPERPAETPVPVTPTPEPTAEPVLFVVEETATPVPLTPTPVPPTPTPDPYTEGSEKTVCREGFYYVELNDALKERITGMSYPKDVSSCRVSFDELRYLRILYVDFEGAEHVGELIVNRKLAGEVLEIFAKLYDAKYPLTSVRLVDDYGEPGDDNLSMAADNTSSFCYRKVTGTKKLSRHSYGAAIDINPMRNPYIKKNGAVSPANGKPYVDRKQDFPGKIDKNDFCYKTFKEYGWEWGGTMKSEKDYQHFSKDIGY